MELDYDEEIKTPTDKKDFIDFVNELEEYIKLMGYNVDDYNFLQIEDFLYECYLNDWDTSKVDLDCVDKLKKDYKNELGIINECINKK